MFGPNVLVITPYYEIIKQSPEWLISIFEGNKIAISLFMMVILIKSNTHNRVAMHHLTEKTNSVKCMHQLTD